MRHDNTLFHGMLQFIPWAAFDAGVEKYQTDRRVRGFDTKSQFISLLHTQFAGLSSRYDSSV